MSENTIVECYDYDWFKRTCLAEQEKLRTITQQAMAKRNSEEVSDVEKEYIELASRPDYDSIGNRKGLSELAGLRKLTSEFIILSMKVTMSVDNLGGSLRESVDNLIDDFSIAVTALYNKAIEIENWIRINSSNINRMSAIKFYLNSIFGDSMSFRNSLRYQNAVLSELNMSTAPQQAKFNRALIMLNGDAKTAGAKKTYINSINNLLQILDVPPINGYKEYEKLKRLMTTF